VAEENAKNNTIRNLLIIIAVILAIGVGYFIFDSVSKNMKKDCIEKATQEKLACQRNSIMPSVCNHYDYDIRQCYR